MVICKGSKLQSVGPECGKPKYLLYNIADCRKIYLKAINSLLADFCFGRRHRSIIHEHIDGPVSELASCTLD